MSDEVSFGRWLHARRKALDLTQEALSERVGCAVDTIRRYEAERLRPSREMAARLAAQLALDEAETERFIHAARQDTRPTPVAAPDSQQTSTMRGLPVPLTPLVGRAAEVTAVCALLRQPQVRLVTLTGPGGTGKTRLALAVAADVGAHFADGVCFADLTPIRDPVLVVSTIARALEVKEVGGTPLLDLLTAELQAKHLLLVLDNFEQVLVAAPLLVDLLRVASGLKVLVTSRASLHVTGEHDYPVPPLEVPDLTQLPDPGALSRYAAVDLFVQRVQATRREFAVTAANAPAVAAISVRLDGLPLALELAAARSKLLTPQALLARLNRRLGLLTGGVRDLPARQQTLRATIEWSYGLLAPAEQRLLPRLAVFVGGWTVDAAEAVCTATGDLEIDVLDGLQALLDQSLLRHLKGAPGEPRVTMLETIREYALERLAASGEAEALRAQHTQYYLGLVEAAELDPAGRPAQAAWRARLALEHDNLRAALQWAWERRDVVVGLRLSTVLWPLWVLQHHREGRHWLEAFSTVAEQWDGPSLEHRPRAVLHVKALTHAGWLAALEQDFAAATAHVEHSLALARELGDPGLITDTLGLLGDVARVQGDVPRARTLLEAALALARREDDQLQIMMKLASLGSLAQVVEDNARAAPILEESLELSRTLGDWYYQSHILSALGRVAKDQGEYGRAARLLTESLTLFGELEDYGGMAFALDGWAALAGAQGQAARSARLFGATEALRERIRFPLLPGVRIEHDRDVAAARTHVDAATWERAWAEGRALTLEQAVAEALAALGDATAPAAAAPQDAGTSNGRGAPHLTAREVQVLQIVAEGATDQDVAGRLGLRPRTVTTYLTRIYAKLDVRTRTAAVRAAREQHVL